MEIRSAALVEKEIQSGQLFRGYLVFGEEDHFHRRIVSCLELRFSGGTEVLQGDEITWEGLGELVGQPSFFGPKLWVVKSAQSLFSDGTGFRSMHISPENCLVLLCPVRSNPAPGAFLTWWDQLGGKIVEARELSFSEARDWVRDKARRDGFNLTVDGAEMLVSIAGRSVEVLENELAKIELYVGSGSEPPGQKRAVRQISSQTVLACAARDPEVNSFNFIDAIASRNLARALSELDDLKSRGTSAVLIVAMLASHLGLLWRVKEQDMKGVPQSAHAQVLGVHQYAAKKALDQSRGWTFGQLEAALRLLCRVDEDIKTGKMDPATGLDFLVLSICKIQ